MNTFMKIISIFLFLLLSCIPQYENRREPFLVVVNTLSENLSYLENKEDTNFRQGPVVGEAPNQIIYNNGYFFVINSLSNSIIKFDKFLNIVKEFKVITSSNPYKAVVINDKIYITSYLLHSVMVYNHNNGDKIVTIQIENIENNGKIYYPFPCGIVRYNNYLFVACKYTPDATASNPLKGRVIIIDITENKIIGYIQSDGYNTTNLYVNKDFLYIISSGRYNNGYLEDGTIEEINLLNFDFNNIIYDKRIVASNNSFGTIAITENFIFTGNIGNSKVIKFNKDFEQIDYKIIKSDGFSFVSAIKYYDNRLFLLEYNSSSLYIIDPFSFSIKNSIKTSLSRYGDPVDLEIR